MANDIAYTFGLNKTGINTKSAPVASNTEQEIQENPVFLLRWQEYLRAKQLYEEAATWANLEKDRLPEIIELTKRRLAAEAKAMFHFSKKSKWINRYNKCWAKSRDGFIPSCIYFNESVGGYIVNLQGKISDMQFEQLTHTVYYNANRNCAERKIQLVRAEKSLFDCCGTANEREIYSTIHSTEGISQRLLDFDGELIARFRRIIAYRLERGL